MEESAEVKPTRRRRHSAEFKAQAIKACMQPGVSIAAVALHYRLNANLLRRWVATEEETQATAQALGAMATPGAEFVPLSLPAAQTSTATQDIVIELRRGATMVTIRWPYAAASECARWLQGWLR